MTADPADSRPPTPDELAELMQPGADWDKDGFHPTMNRPFPSMQCTGVVKSGDRAGKRCAKKAVYGATVCLSHGAQLPVVRRRAEAIVESARLKLVGTLDDATDWLVDLAENSTSDAVRLKATTEIMDRSGLKAGTDVTLTLEDTRDPAALLRERLQKLHERTVQGELVEPTSSSEDDTLSATPTEE